MEKASDLKLAPFVQRMYDALKRASYGQPQLPIKAGVAAISMECALNRALSQMWVQSMDDAGLINLDGKTIWLVKDYGPRPKSKDGLSDPEREIVAAHKIPVK
jgi:hypothetical protein